MKICPYRILLMHGNFANNSKREKCISQHNLQHGTICFIFFFIEIIIISKFYSSL